MDVNRYVHAPAALSMGIAPPTPIVQKAVCAAHRV